MTYHVIFFQDAIDTLKKMDRPMAARVYSWIGKNLEGCTNPRKTGKVLQGFYKAGLNVSDRNYILFSYSMS